MKTLQDGFVGDAFFLIEELEKLLDRRLELTFRPIAHFAPIPLAESTIGNASRYLLKPADISIPAHEVNK